MRFPPAGGSTWHRQRRRAAARRDRGAIPTLIKVERRGAGGTARGVEPARAAVGAAALVTVGRLRSASALTLTTVQTDLHAACRGELLGHVVKARALAGDDEQILVGGGGRTHFCVAEYVRRGLSASSFAS